MIKYLLFNIALSFVLPVLSWAQADNTGNTSEAIAKSNAELDKKAADWSAGLKLPDTEREKKVAAAIAIHLKAVRDWNNDHPFTLVPEGINPATGNKLSEMDRQIIVNSSKPASIHEN